MKLCILDNDVLDESVRPVWGSYSQMCERLLREAGFQGAIDAFQTTRMQYPDSFDDYDAVLLTGSRYDAFSSDPWVVELRSQVTDLLGQQKKLLGICFGHQLIAACLGAPVARAPQGWGLGRQVYQWHGLPGVADEVGSIALLASHQDQVLELPPGASLLTSHANCPVAGYFIGTQVLCLQSHPEFDADYMAFLLDKRRGSIGEAAYQDRLAGLQDGHEGLRMGRIMVRFLVASL